MPGYIKKVLQKYLHESPAKPQHSPYIIAPKKYGKEAHNPLPPDESSPVSKEKIKRIQGIVGISIGRERCLLTVSFTMPTDVALSQWMGVGSCGCPISASVRRNNRPSFMFKNNAPNSASAADEATNLRKQNWERYS